MRNKRFPVWMVVAAVVPLLCAMVFAFVQPRPYGVAATDQEHEYLYHAHLLNEGKPLWSANHPGIPVYYLGAALMALNGTDLADTNRFLRTARLTTAFVTTLALFLALWVVRSTGPSVAVTLLFGAMALAWPSSLSYLDYFGADALVFPVSLILTATTWRYLHHPSHRMLFILGVVAGLGLAIKLSLVPLVLSVMVALAVRSRLPRLLSFVVVMLALFILGTLPSADRMIHSFARAFQREVVSGAGRVLPGATETWISASAPAFVVTVLALSIGVWLLIRSRRTIRSPELPALLAFAGSGLLCFVYFLVRTPASSPDPGLALRNIAPTALVLPVLVLLIDRLSTQPARRPFLLGGLALLVAAYPIVRYAHTRQTFITETQTYAAHVQSEIEAYRQPGLRLAFWDGSPGIAFSDTGFHFWGNYRYAHEEFDAVLLHTFPRFSFFRLRSLRSLIDQERGVERVRSLPAWTGWIGDLYLALLRSPSPYAPREIGRLHTGDTGTSSRDAVLLAPRAEFELELRPYTPEEGIQAIRDQMGPITVQEIQLAGEPWLVFTPVY